MKKVLLSAIAVFTFGIITAQEKTGFSREDVFISGSVNLNFSDNMNGSSTSGFTISPQIGYFVSGHVAIGAGLDVEESRQNTKTAKFNSYVFGRYYATPANQFSIFGQLQAGYGSTRTEDSLNIEDHRVEGFNVGFAPGISYFISKHFALESSLGIFEYTTDKPTDLSRTNKFNFDLNLRKIKFGVIYRL